MPSKRKPTDTERLDWMQRDKPDVYYWRPKRKWQVDGYHRSGVSKSLRAAIDAAMRTK